MDVFSLRSAADRNMWIAIKGAFRRILSFLIGKISDFKDHCDPLESLTYEISLETKILLKQVVFTKKDYT